MLLFRIPTRLGGVGESKGRRTLAVTLDSVSCAFTFASQADALFSFQPQHRLYCRWHPEFRNSGGQEMYGVWITAHLDIVARQASGGR